MNKEKLKQYRALRKEIPKLKKDIQRLTEALDEVPAVAGRVMKSSDDFPYTKQEITVQMLETKQEKELRKQIAAREFRLEQAERDRTEIEEFIATVPDSAARQMFELLYLSDKKLSQRKMGDMLGYDQSSVSLKINKEKKGKGFIRTREKF